MGIRMGNNISNYLSGKRAFSGTAAKAQYTSDVLQQNNGNGGNQSTKSIAFSVREHGMILADDGRNSIISKALEGKDTKVVRNEVNEFTEAYNNMITRLNKSGNQMDGAYVQEFSKLVKGAEDSLKKVGITMKKDGTLSLDKAKLAEASPQELKACFQGKQSFAAAVATNSVAVGVGSISSSADDEGIFGVTGKSRSSTVFSAKMQRYRNKYHYNRRV